MRRIGGTTIISAHTLGTSPQRCDRANRYRPAMSPTAMPGRDGDWHVVAACVDAAVEGRAGLVLDGGAGLGKTTLWAAGLVRAEAAGCVVLRAMPSEVERTMSHGGVVDLVRDLRPHLSDERAASSAPVLDALHGRSSPSDPAGTAVNSLSIALWFRDSLVEVSQLTPIVIAVDDVQWLDDASMVILTHVTRRLDGARVSVLMACRTDELALDVADVSGLPAWIDHHALGPLADEVVSELVIGRIDAGPNNSARVDAIVSLAGGNPFVALELAAANQSTGAPDDDELHVPAAVGAIHARRLAAVSPSTRDILLGAALCAAPTVGSLAASDIVLPSELEACLHEAVDAGLLDVSGDRVRFSHPLFSSAVIAASDSASRRLVHAALARIAVDLEQRARHLDAASFGRDEQVAGVLVDAAVDLLRRGALSACEALARRAVERAEPDGQVAASAGALLGEAAYLRGDLVAAEQLLMPVVDSLPTSDQASAHMLLLRIVAESDPLRAGSFFAAALASVTDLPVALVELRMWQAQFASLRLDLDEAVSAAQAAVDASRELGSDGLRSEALATAVIVSMTCGRGFEEDLLVEAVRLRDPDRPMNPATNPLRVASGCYLFAGRLVEAVQATETLGSELRRRDRSLINAFVMRPGVAAACALGRLDLAEEFVGLVDQHTNGRGILTAAGNLSSATLAAFRGDVDLAVACSPDILESLAAHRHDLPLLPLHLAPPLTLAYHSAGRFEELEATIGPVSDLAVEVNFGEPGIVAFSADRADGLVALGRVDEAELILDWLGGHADRLDRTWVRGLVARVRARIAAERGDLDDALALATDSLQLLTRAANPFEVARTQISMGMIHRRRRSRRAAVTALSDAHTFFDRAGMELLAARTRAELDRFSLGRSEPGMLTVAERRTAELAAMGHSNREIGLLAQISERTVEAQMSKAFRKLGIRRRVELATALQVTER